MSTLNRELAIHLAEDPKLEVTLLVPEGACTEKEKREAKSYKVTIVDAKFQPGYDPLYWLSFPPEDLSIDIVVGHGAKLGAPAQIIRNVLQRKNCKWVQVVHTAPEDLGRYKRYTNSTSKGENKHHLEVELCKRADIVVSVGSWLANVYSTYLRRWKEGKDIFTLTPGLFEREFGDLVHLVKQAVGKIAIFKVLMVGRCDEEDFEVKGYNIAAVAFTDHRLRNKPYELIVVGAPEGKQDKVKKELLKYGIVAGQLTVRKFVNSRDEVKTLFAEVNLVIMPSNSEGFGLVALEALSAGLPILVSRKSGFAKALEEVSSERTCVMHSDDPAKWAEAIAEVHAGYEIRLKEIKDLKTSYGKMYSWKKQCEALVERMREVNQDRSCE